MPSSSVSETLNFTWHTVSFDSAHLAFFEEKVTDRREENLGGMARLDRYRCTTAERRVKTLGRVVP